jgi:hypothetical protein
MKEAPAIDRAPELAFSRAIFADEKIDARKTHADRSQRPFVLGEHRAEQHASL